SEEVKKTLEHLIEELRNAMFLVGANSIEKLKNVPLVITGKPLEWLRLRGFNPEIYARRSLK
ncbi:MAG TPA: type 2 isopentenyl-diphosphate Delta-isomerase, partial [Candidatus Bathyarchaeota archaeon]|nr:type 2 isopentenyl-diphosphate Delta-isomerase [Candidatus Bathyarchaeota archaeon]HEX68678.1 type 2 isopentenyl-diphosphate Delta-isomerase [Candidatus Bathyarchaeota archaeon]